MNSRFNHLESIWRVELKKLSIGSYMMKHFLWSNFNCEDSGNYVETEIVEINKIM